MSDVLLSKPVDDPEVQAELDARYLASVGTAGTYGDESHVPQITTDGNGRVVSVTEVPVTGGGSGGSVDGGSP